MKSLKATFIIFCLLFLGLQVVYFLSLPVPELMRFYLADFLCMPIVLSSCLYAVRYHKRAKSIYLKLSTVLSLWALYSIYFELLLPGFHWRYTGDVVDVLLYFSGSLLFYFLQKQP